MVSLLKQQRQHTMHVIVDYPAMLIKFSLKEEMQFKSLLALKNLSPS